MRSVSISLLIGGSCLLACGGGTSSPDPHAVAPDGDATAEERVIARALRARTDTTWTVREDAQLHTPAFLAPARGAGPRVTARDFLSRNKDILKLRAPEEELVVERTEVDELSMTHVRMQQVERGVPVTGGHARVHFDGAGRLTSFQQRYVPELAKLEIAPSITPEAALASATSALRARHARACAVESVGDAHLVIDGYGAAPPALAWQLDLRACGRGAWRVVVDAHTAAVRLAFDRAPSITGTGRGARGDVRQIEFLQVDGVNVLVDDTRAAVTQTLDAAQGADVSSAFLVSSESTTSWDTTDPRAPGAAVDAHFVTGVTTDFFAKVLNHRGWDGNGGVQLVFTHVGDDQDNQPGWDNARFDPITNSIQFGDGRDFLNSMAASGSVVAHEFVHAVTNFASKLIYLSQSGALNESISDVFGAVIEHQMKPDAVKNWRIGDGTMKGTTAPMRDMERPEAGAAPQPSHMNQYQQLPPDNDNGGVHVNSGIPNKAAHLMTVGGKHSVSNVTVAGKGIGWDNLAKVWHRANTTYLSENSDFATMAKATLQAAVDLKLSEDDVNTIDCAWKAVGVVQGTCIAPKVVVPTDVGTPAETPADPAAPSPGADPASTEAEDKAPSKKKKEQPAVEEREEEDGSARPAAVVGGCSASPGVPHDAGLLFAALVVLGARRRRTPRDAR